MSAISCQQRLFGTLETGQTVTCYSLRNASGMTINILDYGALLNAVQIPDSRGKMHEMILRGVQLDDYIKQPSDRGILSLSHLGPYSPSLPNTHQTVWKAENTTQDEAASIQLDIAGPLQNYTSSKATHHFAIKLVYTLTAANELIIHTQITLDNLFLPINIVFQPYWNLAGSGDILGHVLQIWSDYTLKTDNTGKLNQRIAVKDTAFDFAQPRRLGEKLTQAAGDSNYDAYFLLNSEDNTTQIPTLRLAARMKEPVSSRTLEVYTTQTGLHFAAGATSDNLTINTKLESTVPVNRFCLSTLNLSDDLSKNLSSSQSYVKGALSYEQKICYKLIW